MRDLNPGSWLNIPLPIVRAFQIFKFELVNLQNEQFQTKDKLNKLPKIIDENIQKLSDEYF